MATLPTCLGADMLEIVDGLDFANEEECKDLDVVLEKLEVLGTSWVLFKISVKHPHPFKRGSPPSRLGTNHCEFITAKKTLHYIWN